MSDVTSNKSDQDGASGDFVYPGLLLPFALIVACFAAWGISTDLTTDGQCFQLSFRHECISGSIGAICLLRCVFPASDSCCNH